MPRKFLGDRIERSVDAIRPSSLTLTADDLKHIPVIPQDFTDDGDKVLSNGNGEKRLSKRFGGTLLLKKRLESVPELFLHDYKKKPHSKLDVIKEKNSRKHLPASKAAMNSKGNRIRLQEKNRVGSVPLQRKSLCRSALPRITVTQPVEHTERWEPLIDRVFVSQPAPIVLPIQTVAPMNPVAMIQKQTQDFHGRNKYGKSDSEILFDEILSAYENIPKKNSTALNSEIDRIIDICSSKNLAKDMETFQTPQIACPDDIETLFSPTTPKLKPAKFGSLNDIISSPEYSTSGGSTYSEHWSSEDELPELESNIWNTPKSAIRSSIVSDSTNEDGYCTAAETIPSTASVEDLDIHNTLPAPVQKPLNSVLPNRLSMRKLKKINLAPPKITYMMNIGDESDEDYVEGDATLRMLQEKIDSIEIASCSSSVYSN
ncbi:dse3p [Saccharomyces arboricola H-6]|uniref:Dse3p n=1 Tax=Saccharomyces arboricola (strain H-6 / AS 2.3317 / CBS 10644) TaxID=1160507 RepID=J8PW59_SACAR|nr:dse3p [Saccharomyces arboricola H-6]